MSGAGDVSLVSSLGVLGGGDLYLREAAEIIAAGARQSAGNWSRSIPPSMRVSVGENVAIISASAPVARPAELRLRHPLFGNRAFWYPPPGRSFLSPAAIALSDAAMAKYAMKIDAMAAKAGFR